MTSKINLTQLNDDHLDALRVEILTEQERRANLARIPGSIAQQSRTYLEGGGDPDELVKAISLRLD